MILIDRYRIWYVERYALEPHLRLCPTAAIRVLTSDDKRRSVNASELLAQLLNVAVTCNGKRHFL